MEKKHRSFSKILLNLRKQHYNSQEPSMIESDMLANGVEINNTELLSACSLEDESFIQSSLPSEQTLKSEVETEQMNFTF